MEFIFTFVTAITNVPKVYIYKTQGFDKIKEFVKDGKSWAFGQSYDVNSDLYETDTWALSSIILHRVLNTDKYRTDSPKYSDLFLIPVVPQMPPYSNGSELFHTAIEQDRKIIVHSTMPSWRKLILTEMCTNLWQKNLTQEYEYLNETTAHKHIFLYLDIGPIIQICDGLGFDEMIPFSVKIMEKMKWLTHELFYHSSNDVRYSMLPIGRNHFSTTINIPFPSCVHTQIDTSSFNKKFLVSFGGSLSGFPQSANVRKKIVQDCDNINNISICKTIVSRDEPFNNLLNKAYQMKSQSIFCMEPGGFGMIRKAIVDALSLRCIPILFIKKKYADMIWPLHWSWRSASSILIDPDDYLTGRIDLFSLLRQIPTKEIEKMQNVIDSNIHTVIYKNESTNTGDAFDILLQMLIQNYSVDSISSRTRTLQ